MKSVSNTIKTIFVFIALLFAGALFAISPVSHSINLQAATPTEDPSSKALKVSNLPQSNVNLAKEDLKVPFLTDAKAPSEYTIRLIDKSGIVHDYNVVKGSNDVEGGTISEDKQSPTQKDFEVKGSTDSYLTIKNRSSNTYKILYIYKVGTKVYYSNTYTVNVIGQDYQLDYAVPSYDENGKPNGKTADKTLFPSQQKVGETLKINKVYAHPVYEKDDVVDYEKWFEADVKLTINGKHYAVGTEHTIDGVKFTPISYDDTSKKYTINFAVAGNYAIEYSYDGANNTLIETKSINVTKDFVKPTSDDITITKPTLPTNTELGDKDIKLPNPTLAYSSTYNNYNVSYKINSIILKQTYGNLEVELKGEEIESFDFTTEFFNKKLNRKNLTYKDLAGRYNVTYKMVDVYGNLIELKNVDWKTIGITSRPDIYLTYDYSENLESIGYDNLDVEKDLDTTVATELKSEYGYTQLLFPAVYAKDKIANRDDLLITRYMRDKSGNIYYLDNVRVDTTSWSYVPVTSTDSYNYNYALKDGYKFDSSETDYLTKYYQQLSKSVNYWFWDYTDSTDSADNHKSLLNQDYSLIYRVYVKDTTPGSSATGTSAHRVNYVYETSGSYYQFNVKNTPTATNPDDEDLDITIGSSVSNGQQVKLGDELDIAVTSSDNKDTRLSNALYYYTSADSALSKGSLLEDVKFAYNIALQELEQKIEYDVPTESGGSNKETIILPLLGKTNVLKSATFVEEMEKLGYKNFKVINAESSSKYTLSIDQDFINGLVEAGVKVSHFELVAATLSDYGTVAVSTVKKLNVANTTESEAPIVTSIDTHSITGLTDGSHKVGQNVEVELPDVSFYDKDDSILSLSIAYYVVPNDDASVDINDRNYYNNPYKYPTNYYVDGNTIYGGKIKTNAVGTYYVVYTATDDAGNTNVTHFHFVVESTTEPDLIVTPYRLNGSEIGTGTRITIDSGETVGFDVRVLDGEGKDVTADATISAPKVLCDGLNWERAGSNNAIIFNDYGDYTVEIKVEYKGAIVGGKAKTYTVSVEKPELKWDNLETFTHKDYADERSDVYFDTLTASQGSYGVTVSVKYTDPSGKNYDAVAENGKWKITTGSKGAYNITYTATSSAGDTITKSFALQVGDNKAPDIEVSNKSVLEKDITFNETNITYVIKLNTTHKIMIIEAKEGDKVLYTWKSYDNKMTDHHNFVIIENDNENGIYNRDYSWSGLKVVLSSENGIVTEEETTTETIEDYKFDVYTYSITGKGDCKLTFSIEDSANNTGKSEFYFSVVLKSEAKGINDNVVGIVLIVVSVVVLLGVIMFFVFTGKKGGTKKITSNKKSTEKTSKKVDETDTDSE